MISITATTTEEFIQMEKIVKELGFSEEVTIKVYKGILGYITIDIHSFTSDNWMPRKFDIDNVSFRLDKDFYGYTDNECFVIETSGKFNGENVTIKTYCQKNERPFVKSLGKI